MFKNKLSKRLSQKFITWEKIVRNYDIKLCKLKKYISLIFTLKDHKGILAAKRETKTNQNYFFTPHVSVAFVIYIIISAFNIDK